MNYKIVQNSTHHSFLLYEWRGVGWIGYWKLIKDFHSHTSSIEDAIKFFSILNPTSIYSHPIEDYKNVEVNLKIIIR